MTSEDNFRDRIEDELAGLRPPPLGGLAGEALTHGRRIRRRERLFGMVGGAAAVAGVAAGAVALGGGFASGGSHSVNAGGPGGGPAAQSAPVTSPTPMTTPTPAVSTPAVPTKVLHHPTNTTPTPPPNTVIGTIPASWKPPAATGTPADPATADGQAIAWILRDDLRKTGSGSASGFGGGAEPPGSNANTTLTWSTPQGTTRFSVSVNKSELDGQGLQSTCNPMYEVDYCAAGKLSDGTVVYVTHGTGEPANGPKTHSDQITIERPDHLQINVVEWSSGPLTDDQLYAIVSDPRWALKMDQSFIAQADQQIRPFGN